MLDRPASPQGQSWGDEYAIPKAHGFACVMFAPAPESPSIFFGDYGALSNPFVDALVDGRPLAHSDVAAVAIAPAPQQWVVLMLPFSRTIP